MNEILACGRNYVAANITTETPWKWVDYYGEVWKASVVQPGSTPTEDILGNGKGYCGQRSTANHSYRILCHKCLIRAGINW